MSDDIDVIRERAEALEHPAGIARHDVRVLLAEIESVTAERDALVTKSGQHAREAERLRSALTAMHRRAQRAEAIADRVAADRPQGAHGRSFGRALANYAAARAAQERDEARAERDTARRAALEEAIAVCQRVRVKRYDDEEAIEVAIEDLRALIDTPVRPAPVSASEGR